MNEFTTKIIKEIKINEINELPNTPFTIKHRDGELYLVTKMSKTSKYALTNLDENEDGYTYAMNDYTKEFVLKFINDRTWNIVKSEIKIG